MKNTYHTVDLSNSRFLITGGAGFIGSHIVDYLIENGAKQVRVLDNLSNGRFANIEHHSGHEAFEFLEGDIRDYSTCIKAIEGIDYISHQAALGSVPRSIEDPITTNSVNISGFLNMLNAAKNSPQLKRFVYAASSSTFGDSPSLPKVEGHEGDPLSPYAVTKAVNEIYADVYAKVFRMNTIGLRYFNIFGPRQDPNNPYAAVIPIFSQAFLNGISPVINGDGETSRDFTFVDNAVQANIRAFFFERLNGHEVYNVACGDQCSLNEMVSLIKSFCNSEINAKYGPERAGDVKHSRASIDKIKKDLDYEPTVYFKEGLELVFNWYQTQNSLKNV